MSLCILAGGKVTALALSAFTLSWTHSVQKSEWREAAGQVHSGYVTRNDNGYQTDHRSNGRELPGSQGAGAGTPRNPGNS